MSEEYPQDYESLLKLHISLKQEHEEQDTAYEDYIKILEDRKTDLESKLTMKEKEIETSKKEISKLRDLNNDRSQDNEYLEKKLKKMEENEKKNLDKISYSENKLVELENENNQYYEKLRQLEVICEEYKHKLDKAIEENIIFQNEYDQFKIECDEKIQRIQEELEDNKNEVLSKEQIINKLISHRDFVKTDNKRKSITHSDNDSSFITNNLLYTKGKELKDIDEISNKLKQINATRIIPDNFLRQVSQSFLNSTKQIGEDLNNLNENKDEKFILQKIQNEVKHILERKKTFLIATLIEEAFSFEIVNIEGPSKLDKIKSAILVNEAIDEALQKLKERKEKVLNQKKLLQSKFDKLGIKVNY